VARPDEVTAQETVLAAPELLVISPVVEVSAQE